MHELSKKLTRSTPTDKYSRGNMEYKEFVDGNDKIIREWLEEKTKELEGHYGMSFFGGRQILGLTEKSLEEPSLGLATTKQLIDEIRARIEMDGKLEYRTVNDE